MNIEKVREAISRFENINTFDESGYKTARNIFGYIGKLPALVDVFDPGIRMVRARVHNEPVLFTKIKAIATPPKRFLKTFGRCNKPASPIFYCSENRPTSYLELLHSWPDELDHMSPLYATIGGWYTKVPLNFLIIPNPEATERKSTFDKYYGAAIDKEFAGTDAPTRAAYSLYYRYLVSKLRCDNKENKLHYIITTAYFDFVMNEADNRKGKESYVRLDGLIYPSVKNRGETLNYAIRPHLIKPENFELRTVYREAFRRADNPPFIPDWNQVEQIEAVAVDQQKGDIHWNSEMNKILTTSFSPYEKYHITRR